MEGKVCTIQILEDGKFVYDGYGYDNLDELVNDLKADLAAKQKPEDAEVKSKKQKVKEIIGDEDEN